MTRSYDPAAVAQFILDAHAARRDYANLPPEIAPATIAEAYAAQEALAERLIPREGPVAGLKIATTTKIMQQLMGIDHPLGGMIFAHRIHRSPATLRLADHIHVVIECELAVRIGRDLPAGTAWSAETVAPAVAAVMPAFELIEDRRADYKRTQALSLIADNSWNAGVVLGAEIPFGPARPLTGLSGRLVINGEALHEGSTDDPLGALAWIANLAAGHGRPLAAGMVVITGSVIPTLPIRPGDSFVFTLDGFGSTEIVAE
jgi:2-keto-4-pentenoate hydratase